MFVVLVCTDDGNYTLRCVAEPITSMTVTYFLDVLAIFFNSSYYHQDVLTPFEYAR
jgi:hypothetical protein